MPVELNLSVPARQVAKLTAEYIQIPSAQGKMGVLTNHAPLRCVIDPGVITCKRKDETVQVFAVSGGLAVVGNNEVTVLVDSAEPAEDVDSKRAAAARERAMERLRSMNAEIDHVRAEAALKRALARLQAAGLAGRGR